MSNKELLKRVVVCAFVALVTLAVVGLVPLIIGYSYGYLVDHTPWGGQLVSTSSNHGDLYLGDLFRWSALGFSVVTVFIAGSELIDYGIRGGCTKE